MAPPPTPAAAPPSVTFLANSNIGAHKWNQVSTGTNISNRGEEDFPKKKRENNKKLFFRPQETEGLNGSDEEFQLTGNTGGSTSLKCFLGGRVG